MSIVTFPTRKYDAEHFNFHNSNSKTDAYLVMNLIFTTVNDTESHNFHNSKSDTELRNVYNSNLNTERCNVHEADTVTTKIWVLNVKPFTK